MAYPEKGEGLFGYLLRLQSLNLYSSMGWIAELCGEHKFRLNYACMDNLSSLLPRRFGGDEEAYRQMSYELSPDGNNNYLLFHGNRRVDRGCFTLGSTRICPKCLAEFGYSFKAWELRCFTVCPRHKVFLTQQCHSCGGEIDATRKHLFKCSHCDADLRTCRGERAPQMQVELAKLISSKAGVPFKCEAPSIAAEWADMSLADLVANILLLYRHHPDRRLCARMTSKINWLEANKLVARCILDWPYGFTAYFEALKGSLYSRHIDLEGTYVGKLGRFYQVIALEDTYGRFQHLKEFLIEYLNGNEEAALASGRGCCVVYDREKRSRPFLTKSETCAELGISSCTFYSLFNDGILDGLKLDIGDQHVYRIRHDSVKSVKTDVLHSLSYEELECKLNITKSVRRNLIECGVVRPLWGGHRYGNNIARILDEEVDRLLSELSSRVKPIFTGAESFLPFGEAYRFAARLQSVGAQRFLRGIRDGLIVPRGIADGETGLEQFIFCEWDIRNLANDKMVTVNSLLSNTGIDTRLTSRDWLRGQLGDLNSVKTHCLIRNAINFAETYISKAFLDQQLSPEEWLAIEGIPQPTPDVYRAADIANIYPALIAQWCIRSKGEANG